MLSRSTSAYLVLIRNLERLPLPPPQEEPPTLLFSASRGSCGAAGKVIDTANLPLDTGRRLRSSSNFWPMSKGAPPTPAKAFKPLGNEPSSLRWPTCRFAHRRRTSLSRFCALMATFQSGKARPGMETWSTNKQKLSRFFISADLASLAAFFEAAAPFTMLLLLFVLFRVRAKGEGVWPDTDLASSSRLAFGVSAASILGVASALHSSATKLGVFLASVHGAESLLQAPTSELGKSGPS
mmetsp:Transcript_72406/g.207717  ORF Transcript_72406/g.207717 Transcript_72406/m.207717 type:complete len:239 (+) Transcript_72406:678-1394(+)